MNENVLVYNSGGDFMLESITSWDFSVLDYILTNLKCSVCDFLFPILDKIGYAGAMFILLGIILLFFKKTRATGIMVLIGLLLINGFGEFLIKPLVGRIRPCNLRPIYDMLVKAPSSPSFPSGHMSAATVTAVVMFMRNKKSMWFMFLVALLVGFSRCYLYVHYPSDVIAGALLGIICGLLVYYIFKLTGLTARLDRKKEKNNG